MFPGASAPEGIPSALRARFGSLDDGVYRSECHAFLRWIDIQPASAQEPMADN
jgi:hypothetical protein